MLRLLLCSPHQHPNHAAMHGRDLMWSCTSAALPMMSPLLCCLLLACTSLEDHNRAFRASNGHVSKRCDDDDDDDDDEHDDFTMRARGDIT